MKVHELMHLLSEYPDDTEIRVCGFKWGHCDDWESWHSDKVKFSEDEYDDAVLLEGDLG